MGLYDYSDDNARAELTQRITLGEYLLKRHYATFISDPVLIAAVKKEDHTTVKAKVGAGSTLESIQYHLQRDVDEQEARQNWTIAMVIACGAIANALANIFQSFLYRAQSDLSADIQNTTYLFSDKVTYDGVFWTAVASGIASFLLALYLFGITWWNYSGLKHRKNLLSEVKQLHNGLRISKMNTPNTRSHSGSSTPSTGTSASDVVDSPNEHRTEADVAQASPPEETHQSINSAENKQ